LRLLGLMNVSELIDLSLFKRWSEIEKGSFWEAYEKVKSHPKKLITFRWLTRSSFQAVREADDDGLRIAMQNLDETVAVAGEELRRLLLWIVAGKLHTLEKRGPVRASGIEMCEPT